MILGWLLKRLSRQLQLSLPPLSRLMRGDGDHHHLIAAATSVSTSSLTSSLKRSERSAAVSAALSFLCFHLPHAAVVTARHAGQMLDGAAGNGGQRDWTMQVSRCCNTTI